MPEPEARQGIFHLGHGSVRQGGAAAGLWSQYAFGEDKKEGLPPASGAGASQLTDQISLIAHNDIQSAEDVRDLVRVLIKMGDAVAENPAQYGLDSDQAAAVLFVSDLARSFAQYRIPVVVADDAGGSQTSRTYPEMVERMNEAAEKHGIVIEKGDSIFTAIHEITHAIPGREFLRAAERVFTAQDLSALNWPLLDTQYSSLPQLFIQIASRKFMDEAYSGLAEAMLKRSLGALGIDTPMPIHVREAQKSLERGGIAQYVREGSYIGDNHLLIYNLHSAAVVADEAFHELPRLHAEGIIRSVPHALKKGLHDQDPINILRGIKVFGAEFHEFAANIYQNSNSTHPLKPVIHRIAPYLEIFFETDLSKRPGGTRERKSPPIVVGLRSLQRSAGDPAWIEERPQAARDVVRLLMQYDNYLRGQLVRVLESGEMRAFVPFALMAPDGDLPFVWTQALDRAEYERETARRELFDDVAMYSRPALLPLSLQGYDEQFVRHLSDSQSSLTHAKQWLVTLFNNIEVASRIGEEKAVEGWLDMLEGEATKGWAHRYQLALLDAVNEGIVLTPSGKEMFEAFIDGGSVGYVPPRAFIERLFEIIESTGSGAKGDTGDLKFIKDEMDSAGDMTADERSIKKKGRAAASHLISRTAKKGRVRFADAEEFEDGWSGSDDVRAAARDLRKQLPRVEQVRQLVVASGNMRRRGMAALADRAQRQGAILLDFVIKAKIARITSEIEDRYELKKRGFRANDTFLKHVSTLGIKETDILPYPRELAVELMIIIGLPAAVGGGWDLAMRYLEGVPDGFVKAFACLQLGREMNHLIAPSEEQHLRFIKVWEKAFAASRCVIPERGIVQPNEEFVEFGPNQGEWLQRNKAIWKDISVKSDAQLAFEQEHLSAMFFSIPWSAGEELGALKERYAGALAWAALEKPYLAPRLVPTMYDPAEYIEEVVIKRNRDPKRAYSTYHDPNIVPLRVEVSRLSRSLHPAAIQSAGERIKQAIELVPRVMRAEYIPLLVELSEVASGAGIGSGAYYDMARDLSDEVRKIDAKDFRRRFVYDGMSSSQKSFDLNARLRRYHATWERTGLISFARMARAAEPRAAMHYLEEIHRIVDNESIFDIMESRDYSEAARILDEGPLHSALVFDLFQRAVQTRTREQYEASYDVDHELATRIDASSLDAAEKDELLEQLVEVNFHRVFKSSVHGLARMYEEELFFDELDRILQPFMFMLDLVQERGYVGTEQKLWQGLVRLSASIVDSLPAYAHGIALSSPALMAIVRHPEVVHPQNRAAVAALFDNPAERQDADALFTSVFTSGSTAGHSHLPNAWKIRKASGKEYESYYKQVLAEIAPDSRSPDEYVLGLLNVFFLSEMQYRTSEVEMSTIENLSEFCAYGIVRKVIERFGFKGAQFGKFAVQYPLAAEKIFLSHLDNKTARCMRFVLVKLSADSKLPISVRQAAFSSLLRTGFVSDYVQGRFIEAAASQDAMKEFLDSTEHIFKIRTDEHGEMSLVVYPDWLVAPLFEQIISDERMGFEKASDQERLDEDPGDDDSEENLTLRDIISLEDFSVSFDKKYFVLLSALEAHLKSYAEIPSDHEVPYFLDEILGPDDFEDEYGDDDLLPTRRERENESLLVETYRRNRALVRVSSVRLPSAMQNIDARLKFVMSSYISHIPASTRLLLQGALRRSEKVLGEEDVLRVFFEQTGLEKLAQFLSLQDGVVPDSYRESLKGFQEDLKPSTHREVSDTIDANGLRKAIRLNGDGSALTSRHAGTVGELWEGSLHDGSRVAIKVLPAKKRRRNEQALRALKSVADDLQLFRHRLFGGIDFNDLYRRYHDSVLAEMNYLNEAEYISELAPLMERHGVAYPIVHDALQRRDVMVMDYIDFAEIADIEGEAERQIVVDRLGKWLAKGIFEDGVFYEDFHPGNVKWLKGSAQPLMLDFGRIGRLDEGQREALIRLLVAGVFQDALAARDALIRMSPTGPEADGRRLAEEAKTILASGNGDRASAKVQKLFAAAARCGADLHPNYLQFMKAVVSWEATMRQIKPDVDFSTYAAPVILRRLNGGEGGGEGGKQNSPSIDSSGPATPPLSSSPGDVGARAYDSGIASVAHADDTANVADEFASGVELDDQVLAGGLSLFSSAAPVLQMAML